jgi:uncharacterized protein (DUF2147 family)
MQRIGIGLTFAVLTTATAYAADPNPTGDWSVADGNGQIRVENCNGKMWGAVSWEKDSGVDSNNPDAAKKNLPTLGMPIIFGMKQTQPNKWEGQIYSPENGKFYTGNISLASPDVLRVEGCVLGFLCGGQSWPRVKTDPSRPATAAAPGAARQPNVGTKPAAGAKTTPPAAGGRGAGQTDPKLQTPQEFCAALTRREPSVASP